MNSNYKDIKEYFKIKALINSDKSDEIIKQAHIEALKKVEEKKKKQNSNNEE